MIATIVELDLINYSEIVWQIEFELGLGSGGVTCLNEQIEALVKEAVLKVKLNPERTVKNKSGDGFVLVFASADDAHRFSVEFHKLCVLNNKRSEHKSAHRWFRIGAATGELDEVRGEIAGTSIIEAVRLEHAGNRGHILIDENTYTSLSDVCREEYDERLEKFTDKKGHIHHAHRYKVSVPEDQPAGVVSPQKLHASNQRLSDEVFATELLTKPVILERDSAGSLTVIVDRQEVREMLISNEARLAKTQQYVRPKKKKDLLRLDKEIQRFLADGDCPGVLEINLPALGICLRWASGGILPIVTDQDGKEWVPLFFRDIRPYGWNIALGTPERWFNKDSGLVDRNYNLEADLNSPRTFILREFLEELIVVNGSPRPNGTLFHKRFHFPNNELPFTENRAREFYEKQRLRRIQEDELTIEDFEGQTIEVSFDNPKCALKVVYDFGKEETKGLLICFSLLDLGIEVVRVAKYKFNEDDWMLDGEIRESHVAATGKTEMKLIRMPVAMLSLDYLKETFGNGQEWHRYTFGPQPSIKVTRAPILGKEIKHFDWDVKRRMQAVEGEWGDKWHKDRFVDWYDKFGPHFIKEREKPEDEWQLAYANPSQLFVPATAKILNLYFSMLGREEKND